LFVVSDFSFVVVMIPAVGALVIAIAALRSNSRGSYRGAGSGEQPEAVRMAEGETAAPPFRGIAVIFAVCAFVAVCCPSLFGRSLSSKISVGGNDCSAAFALLTTAAWLPVIAVARRSDHKRPALLYGLLLLLEASYLAIFSCDHAIWLCAALQVNSVLLYLLTTGWSEQASEGLAKKMLFVNLAADFTILIGLMGVVIASARISAPEPNTIPTLTYSLSEITRELPRLTTDDVAAQEYWKHAQRSLLSILILGAAIKAPLVPFHAWFAAVVAEGPPCVAIALVGAGLRIGLYLLTRFIGPLCGDLGGVADLIVGLTILGAFLESLLTYGQANLKKMIACICLLQASLAIAGFFSMRPENASGPLILSLASGVAGVLIIFSLGFLELRYGTAELAGIGGIVHRLPNLAAVFLLATLSLVGIPGLFGFPGLFTTLGAVFGGEWTFAFLAIGSCLIGAWALFSMLQHLVFGSLRLPVPGAADVLIDRESPLAATLDPSDRPQADWNTDTTPREWSIVTGGKSGSIDLSAKELLLLGPLLASLVAVGIWPQAISAALRFALAGSSLSP
jgi:NADH:ubiquinone oxidoreductase subunit 4 (subunit M)